MCDSFIYTMKKTFTKNFTFGVSGAQFLYLDTSIKINLFACNLAQSNHLSCTLLPDYSLKAALVRHHKLTNSSNSTPHQTFGLFLVML